MRAKQNFHYISIVMKKLCVKWAPGRQRWEGGPGGAHCNSDPFHEQLWDNPNLVKIHIAPMWTMHITSGQTFAHATTAELSWHVQNCDLIRSSEKGSSEKELEQNAFSQDFKVRLILSGVNSLRLSDASVKPSHYLNQYWNIVNWTLENKLQWNLNKNSYIFIQEN